MEARECIKCGEKHWSSQPCKLTRSENVSLPKEKGPDVRLPSSSVSLHKDALERVCRWAIGQGFSTGHADTLEELLAELSWQVDKLRVCPACESRKVKNREYVARHRQKVWK